MSEDQRASIYGDLHGRQLAQEEGQNRESAFRILRLLFDRLRPTSVLDVGCGLGTWLRVVMELGVPDVSGVEGAWLDRSRLQVNPALVTTLDLERGFRLDRRFDLAICLEVAEHLSPAGAEPLVGSLVAHADAVLFSAAIPFQGGHHHVNEQFPGYWADLFGHHGFAPIDLIRHRIWDDRTVHWWLRQNTLLFAHERALARYPGLRDEQAVARPLNVVHPDVYMYRMRRAYQATVEHQKILKAFAQGGVFRVTPLPGGRFGISRQGEAGSGGLPNSFG